MSENLKNTEQSSSNPELEETREFTPEEIAELGLLIEIAIKNGELKPD